MAEHRAHLARGEVQHAPVTVIVEKRTLGPNGHEVDELAAIFEQVTPSARPKIHIARNDPTLFHHSPPQCSKPSSRQSVAERAGNLPIKNKRGAPEACSGNFGARKRDLSRRRPPEDWPHETIVIDLRPFWSARRSEFLARGDRGFESSFLQRGVWCEADFRG